MAICQETVARWVLLIIHNVELEIRAGFRA